MKPRIEPTPRTGGHFAIRPYRGSKKLVIFFSATGVKAGEFNFWKFGHRLQCHCIFLNNGEARWYQNGVPGLGSSVEETVETLKNWAASLNADEIYTVGSSMGGYAAILYGCLLDARILSFSAETILSIPGARSVSHIARRTEILYPDLTTYIENAKKPIDLYVGEIDPVDIYCASKVAHSRNIKVTTLVGVGHNSVQFLATEKLLRPALDALLNNEPLPAVAASGRMLTSAGFPELFLSLHQSFRAKDWEAALQHGKAALALYPQSQYCQLHVGGTLMKLRRYSEALPYLAIANSLPGAMAFTPYILGECLRKLGAQFEALPLYDSAVTKDPRHAKSYYSLGLASSSVGLPTSAGKFFAKATTLEPENAVYASKAPATLQHQDLSAFKSTLQRSRHLLQSLLEATVVRIGRWSYF